MTPAWDLWPTSIPNSQWQIPRTGGLFGRRPKRGMREPSLLSLILETRTSILWHPRFFASSVQEKKVAMSKQHSPQPPMDGPRMLSMPASQFSSRAATSPPASTVSRRGSQSSISVKSLRRIIVFKIPFLQRRRNCASKSYIRLSP